MSSSVCRVRRSTFLLYCVVRTLSWTAVLMLPAATAPMTVERRNSSSRQVGASVGVKYMATILEIRDRNVEGQTVLSTIIAADLRHAAGSKGRKLGYV